MRGKSFRKKVSSEVAALLVDAGLIVLVSLISPYRSERDAARERVGAGEFVEVFVDTRLQNAGAATSKAFIAGRIRGS
jgi:bifunctional enzyme CysN/CysC